MVDTQAGCFPGSSRFTLFIKKKSLPNKYPTFNTPFAFRLLFPVRMIFHGGKKLLTQLAHWTDGTPPFLGDSHHPSVYGIHSYVYFPFCHRVLRHVSKNWDFSTVVHFHRFIKDPLMWSWHFFHWVYSGGGCPVGATDFLPATVPAVLYTLAFMPSAQMSAQWTSQVTCQHYYKNSFDLTDGLQGSWGPPGFKDHLGAGGWGPGSYADLSPLSLLNQIQLFLLLTYSESCLLRSRDLLLLGSAVPYFSKRGEVWWH